MITVAGSDKLVMPHEDLERPKQQIPLSDRFSFLKNLSLDLMRMRFSEYERKIDICQKLFNGQNAGTIHRKYDFIEQIRQMGYRGPDQTLYDPKKTDGLTQAISLLKKYGCVLCKPLNGEQGTGIFICENELELLSKLKHIKEGYLIQEYLPPFSDYRYVYHIDPEITYRFCYEKVRPIIIGNGRDNIKTLIIHNQDIPEKSKTKLFRHLSNNAKNSIPEKDERIALVNSGNISKGAYGKIVSDAKLEALDKVMSALINDLKHQCKLELTTFCFDLGVLRNDIAPENVTVDDYVFYEYQIPFGLNGYLSSLDEKAERGRVARIFLDSLQRSWISRQKNSQPISSALTTK